MTLISIRVCDVCEAQEDVHMYEIRRDGTRVKVDLCKEHGATLEGFLKAAKPPRTRTRRASRVTTMKEVEDLKKTES